MSQREPFEGLEPLALWKNFAEFTKIARPSGHEQGMIDYVKKWAAGCGLAAQTDSVGNVVIRIPATPGREKAPGVVLQGHLDMVCERNADSQFDAEAGRINVVRDGDFLYADGTTLGADNGIGLALGMAIAETPGLVHGPVELLMTVDEETGMTGAQGLDGSMIQGRIMLNLDSEDDTVLFAGCAGGADLKLVFEAPREAVPEGLAACTLSVKGLKGGHSGIDINRNRLNAIRALAILLQDGGRNTTLRVSSIFGGSKRNAIPREAQATVLVPAAEVPRFIEGIETVKAALAFQYQGLDDGLTVQIEPIGGASDSWNPRESQRLLDLLRALPTGVIAMSQALPGLVETSTNLGVVTTAGDKVEILCLSRSSVSTALADAKETHFALARLAGAKIEYLGGYPGWKPNMDSKALAAVRKSYKRLFGNDPEVTAIHAGLECGLIGERLPGMDMVSFGPLLVGVHAPGEKVSISSTQKIWKLLGAVLEDLSS